MGDVYTIEHQVPTTYVSDGAPVRGYTLTVRLHRWNEVARINVPDLDPELIDTRLREIISKRERLEQLGG